jgi:biopolymer transport protein ExbD
MTAGSPAWDSITFSEGSLANWDVFHADRLELERGLEPSAIRQAFKSGQLRDDDLVRPAGTTVAWSRLADMPELTQPAPASAELAQRTPVSTPVSVPRAAAAPPPSDYEVESDDFGPEIDDSPATLRAPDFVQLGAESDVAFPIINDAPQAPEPPVRASKDAAGDPPGEWLWAEEVEEDDEDFKEETKPAAAPAAAGGLESLDDEVLDAVPVEQEVLDAVPVDLEDEDLNLADQPSRLALPVIDSRGWDDIPDGPEEEEEGDISLSRSGPATVEELDLAPMVDVAFQLVLFFMVTATTVLYKTLEIPKPSQEQAPTAVAQGRSLEDLQEDNVLVEVDPTGNVKIDREPVRNTMEAIVEQLRTAREKTGRKTMLLSADYATKHRHCVLVIDAAHEIGMNIVIAKPAAPQAAAPSMLTAPAAPAAPL